MLSEEALKVLEGRGIDPEMAAAHGVESLAKNGFEWLKIPFYRNGIVVQNKYRRITGEKRFYQDSDGVKCVWNEDVLLDQSLKDVPLIITEGEMDALAAIQCGFARTISVPDGAPAKQIEGESQKYTYLDYVLDHIRDCREVIIAADGDGPGANLLHDLSLRIGRARCKWVQYPQGCKDLNDVLRDKGQKALVEVINSAKWCLVDGVYKLSEIAPPPVNDPVETGFGPGMDQHFKPRLGDFCVITGIPSHGKSSFLNDLCCRVADRHGWVTAFASFEQSPKIDHYRNMVIWRTGRFPDQLSPQELDKANAWIDAHFSFIVPSEDDDVTLEWVLERAGAAVVQHGAKIIVIDPWNEMDHDRPNGMTLTEYTGFAIKHFKKFAKKHNIFLIVAAHPKKLAPESGKLPKPTLYDISDSSHWFNKADMGLVIHRDGQDTSLYVDKIRYQHIIGKPGQVAMNYDFKTNKFYVMP